MKQDDHWLDLMVYGDTVIAAIGCSHAQLMMGRHIRTTLPTLPTALRPRWPNPDLVRQKDFDTKINRHIGATTIDTTAYVHYLHCLQEMQ